MDIPCRAIDLKNKKFGRLTVIDFVEIRNHSAYWSCKCSCGNTKVINGNSLRSGATKSCGCYNKEYKRKPNSGQFKKGHNGYVPPKGTHMSPDTEFKPGTLPSNFKGYRVPRIINNKGKKEIVTTVKELKMIGVANGKSYVRSRVTTYARVVYCKHHGITLEELGTQIIWHKDMNPFNNEPNNLEIITRAELLQRNRSIKHETRV